MRILWFTNSPCGSARRYKKDGAGHGWLVSLEDEIKKRNNIELHVSYFSNNENNEFTFEGVSYHPILLKRNKHGIKRVLDRYSSLETVDRKTMPTMLSIVNEVKPDLIHIHGTEERFALIQDYIHDIPICISIQGLIGVLGEKYFSGMTKTDVAKYETLWARIRHVSFLDDYYGFVYRGKRENRYLIHAKYILGRTFWDKDITLAMNPKRKYYVANEVMRKPFYIKEWNKTSWSEDKLRIVSTISGGIYKGYEVVLKTAKILKQYSKINFQWDVIGYNSKSKWANIASHITNLNPQESNINLLGRLDAEQLSQQLVDSDIYVHVSHIENSPNSVCEAMLVGMPVIASFAGGTASLLKNGEEGLLVQDGDPYVLAGAIVDMYQHFDKAREFGRKARETALIRHNPKRITDSLIETYEEIIKDSRAQ